MGPASLATRRGMFAGVALAIAVAATSGCVPVPQTPPNGSYLATCQNVAIQGATLMADCQRMDGYWNRSALDLRRCRGDVANLDGQLACQFHGY